jgi:hypothetical protein
MLGDPRNGGKGCASRCIGRSGQLGAGLANAGTFAGMLIPEFGYIAKRGLVTMALTDLEIKRAKTKDKPYKLSDGGNVYLWVTLVGGKLWRWRFRYEGKAKLMTFGRYPDVPLAY